MNIIASYPFFFRLMSVIIAPTVISLYTISRIRKLTKESGGTYYRDKRIPKGIFVFVALLVLLSFILIDFSEPIRSLLVIILLIASYLISFAERIMESLYQGIYENQIVMKGFTCEWSQVEGVIFGVDTIRFVHKQQGAFDFKVPKPKIDEIKESILKHTCEIEGSIYKEFDDILRILLIQ